MSPETRGIQRRRPVRKLRFVPASGPLRNPGRPRDLPMSPDLPFRNCRLASACRFGATSRKLSFRAPIPPGLADNSAPRLRRSLNSASEPGFPFSLELPFSIWGRTKTYPGARLNASAGRVWDFAKGVFNVESCRHLLAARSGREYALGHIETKTREGGG